MGVGADRVRASFNPSGENEVSRIKNDTATLIDRCEDMKSGGNQEKNRLAALAQTAYEEAAMWAVKAATIDSTP